MPFMVCLASAFRLRFFMEPVNSSFGRSSARGGVDADAPAASPSGLEPVPEERGGSGICTGSLIAASSALVESEGCLRADERHADRGGTGDARLRANYTTRRARVGADAERARRAARAPRTTLGGSCETDAGSRARRASLADPRAPAMERSRRADRSENGGPNGHFSDESTTGEFAIPLVAERGPRAHAFGSALRDAPPTPRRGPRRAVGCALRDLSPHRVPQLPWNLRDIASLRRSRGGARAIDPHDIVIRFRRSARDRGRRAARAPHRRGPRVGVFGEARPRG